ncbi:SDR family oxidoreductase [Hahella sp. KA22]|uniref:SDR family oxidoreductase n=1 Tax=Hahella sp. KA22 TaxID=1628392 RepID=UPI000FDE4923|nr:SDR family oxidoreductase [Hahella sp. KA22]AZZ91818.1 SDR family oxidoreductase [Hahella sp. KA22]QAY55188.1 SDR family oxidoreductase [Hahella sp. KA22]
MKLDGKVVMVTGASSGIGRTTAIKLADYGAKVAVIARRSRESEDTVRHITEAGRQAISIPADVSSEGDIKNALAQIIETFGKLDGAFNNAGAAEPVGPLTELSEQEWDRVFSINTKGAWLCMKHQIPALLSNKSGAIVNMSSIYGLVGTGMGLAAYVASKHAIIGLTKAASLEYAARNIRINAICPGWIPTPGNEQALSNPEVMAFAQSLHPQGRLGTQQEVAEAVCWMLSDSASYLNGQTISIDGGYTAQ